MLPTGHRHVTDTSPTVGRLVVCTYGKTCRSSVSRLSAVCWSTVGRLSANRRPRVDQQSANRFLGSSSSRLISENLPQHTVFPKLLPRNHVFTSLVIKSFHKKLMYTYTLAAIRREFWIQQGRSSVRGVLLNCLRCRQHQGGPYRTPTMASYHDQE